MKYEQQIVGKLDRLNLLITKTKEMTSNNPVITQLLAEMEKTAEAIQNLVELEGDD